MEVKFGEKYMQESVYPTVVRHHIWPCNILMEFEMPICECNNRENNGFNYCLHCGFAIPTKEEKETYKVK